MLRPNDSPNEMLAAKLQSTMTLIERLIALGAFAGLLFGVVLVLRPFITGILFGTILVIATWPVREWLVRHGLSVSITATVLLLIAIGTVGVPAIILAPGLGERLVDGVQRVQAYFAGSPALPNWVAHFPWAKESIGRLWSSLADPGSAFQAVIKPYSAELRKALVEIARAFADGVFQFVVSLAVATMLWLRGDALAGTLREITERLGGSAGGAALLMAADSVRGVAYGVVGTAAIQAIAMTVGLMIAGVPGSWATWILNAHHRTMPIRAIIGRNLGRRGLVARRQRRHGMEHLCCCLGPARLDRRQFHPAVAGEFRSRDAINFDLSWRTWWVLCIRVSRSVYRPNIARRILQIAPSLA